MHEYASETQEARELLSDLEYLWDQVKDIEPSESASGGSVDEHLDNMSSTAAALAAAAATTRGGDSYGIRSASTSAAGGSYIVRATGSSSRHKRIRPEYYGDAGSTISFDASAVAAVESLEMRKWQSDVTWALETINEEIMAIRDRYAAGQASTGSARGSQQQSLYSYSRPSEREQALRHRVTGSVGPPGSNDDGSGSRSLVEMLRQFTRLQLWKAAWGITRHLAVDFVVLYLMVELARAVRGNRFRQRPGSLAGRALVFVTRVLDEVFRVLGVRVMVL